MFGRSTTPDPATPTVDDSAATSGKGRPTPTRKEAEAARKATLKVPSDPKAAKAAMKQRERDARTASRAAVAAGDVKNLPARDAGPVRAFARDWVDRRRSIGEVFIPVAVLVLVLGFVRNPTVTAITYYAWLVMMIAVAADIGWQAWKLNGALKEQWPDKADRKGVMFYAGMRSLTIRRLRLPPPRLKAGGAPVTPRGSKAAASGTKAPKA
jgi:hypothetical protein